MAKTWWLWLIGGLIALGYTVPYTVLRGVEHWYGAFLFWLIFGVVVWLVLSLAVLGWTSRDADAVLAENGEDGA